MLYIRNLTYIIPIHIVLVPISNIDMYRDVYQLLIYYM